MRVLVVEDEPVVAMCLEDILEALGCVTVGPASRLSEGLALARDAEADAAILDINLGGERSDAIAETLSGRGIPFVLASGYPSAPEGFTHAAPLIEKPYREHQVEAALAALLRPAQA
jgi:DNA-binding response OmpR family regulator